MLFIVLQSNGLFYFVSLLGGQDSYPMDITRSYCVSEVHISQ